jgi:hypothetical protein
MISGTSQGSESKFSNSSLMNAPAEHISPTKPKDCNEKVGRFGETNPTKSVVGLAHPRDTNRSSNIGSVTVAISDATPTVASRVSAKSQAYYLQERLATAHGRPVSVLGETLALLEREHRTVDHLLVISTRSMPEHFGDAKKASQATLGTAHAFWRSIRWIDIRASETSRYFTPTP